MNFSVRYILFECLRPRREKYGVVFSPDCENRRLVFAKCLVPLRILLHVVLIVVKQGELNHIASWTVQRHLIKRIAVRADPFWVGKALCILKLRRFDREQLPDFPFRCMSSFFPVWLD